ncbi:MULTISPECIES: hypothetical protein [Pseudomonas]|uniref:hypothetical protein n=1 Tax=Pseudomonas TaxID=286 RepID=UPI0011AEEAD8|nr:MULTISPECIES: hypothetical protein [Pseudomonas]
MALRRSKAACTSGNVNIHNTVQTWWNAPQISYVAHAYLANGTIVCLRPPLSAGANNQPANHPDQQYWRTLGQNGAVAAIAAITNAIAGAGGVGNITSIDIDCKLMPCTGQHGCLYSVPTLMRTLYGLNNTPLRIFSHADENMGGGASSKRVILSSTAVATNAATLVTYNQHDGWGWVP